MSGKLSQQLGVPVIATSASKRTGIAELKKAIVEQLAAPAPSDSRPSLPEAFYRHLWRFPRNVAVIDTA